MRTFFLWVGWPLRIVIGAPVLIIYLVYAFVLGLLGFVTPWRIERSLWEIFTWVRGDNI